MSTFRDTPLDPDSLFQRLIDRLQLAEAAEEWNRCVSQLDFWEGENLAVQNPAEEALSEHKQMVERLMLFGQLCGFIASYPEFHDHRTAELIHATQLALKEKLNKWHLPKGGGDEPEKMLKT